MICYGVGVALLIPELPQCSAFELAAAVRRTITEGPASRAATSLEGRLPTSEALREAGDQLAEARHDNAKALALLEAPYLVAASDGLEPQERQALSALIAHLVGTAAPEAVCDVLEWFDARLAEEGLETRMDHIAKSFESRREREQVLGFAALLALADRRLALSEQQTLLQLAEVLGFKRAELQMLVHKISLRLERAMAVSIMPMPIPPEDEIDEAPATPVPVTPPAGSHAGGTPPTERSS